MILQDDAMYPTLTARETLMFSARLRLPGAMKLEEKRTRVESLLEMLGLKECADTYVGDDKVNKHDIFNIYALCAKLHHDVF
jgi:ABC-type multidrug transport system ATPase subunit